MRWGRLNVTGRSSLLVFCLWVTASAWAVPSHASVWILAGAANTQGRNGTHFSTDIKVFNAGSSPASLTFGFFPASGDAPPAPVGRSVGAGETLIVSNVLQTLWGAAETSGTLRIGSDQALLIMGRTYNDATPPGTYGAGLEAVPYDGLIQAGETGHAPWVVDSADPTTRFRSNVAGFLDLPGTSLDIVIFDDAGTEVGRTTVAGGPKSFQLSVASITGRELLLGRAEFRVTAGKATGYVAIVDNVTGDSIVVQAVPALDGATDVALDGVAHAPGREGTHFQTDVCLYNASGSPASVSVEPLSVSGDLPALVTVDLAGGAVREVKDILGTLFSAADGAKGALRFRSSGPVSVLARTANVRSDGSPGSFGAFQRPVPFGNFIPAGGVGRLIGLRQSSAKPGYRTNIGFLAGAAGAAGDLVLRDRTGQILDARPGAVALSPFGWMQPSIADLLPGTSIPDDSTLETTVTAGSLDMYSSILDNVTGDSVVTAVAGAPLTACPGPAIVAFFSDPEVLSAPGDAELHWVAGSADSVRITPGPAEDLPYEGSLTVSASGPSTFTLVATGPCGTSRQSLTLPVGTPSIISTSIASASPGQLITIQVANIASLDDISGVVFTFPGFVPVTMDVFGFTESGDVMAVVPFVPESSSPGGYLTGSCQIALEVRGTNTQGRQLTIEALSPSGADPVAAFRVWLSTRVDRTRAALAGQGSLPGAATAVPPLTALVDSYAAVLRKMADDIDAGGSAMLPVDLPTTVNPSPVATLITRDQLAAFMALVANTAAVPASDRRLRSATASSSSSCSPSVTDDPAVAICLVNKLIDPGQLFDALQDPTLTVTKGADCFGIEQVARFGLGALLDYLSKIRTVPQVFCSIFPVYLSGFRMAPTPDPIPVSVTSETPIYAKLIPTKNKDEVVKAIIDAAVGNFLKRFRNITPECREAIGQSVSVAIQAIRGSLTAGIEAVLGTFGTAPGGSREIQVGSCDLYRTEPGNSSLLKLDLNYRQGRLNYYFRGLRSGKTYVYVEPYVSNFLFPEGRLIPGKPSSRVYPLVANIGSRSPKLVVNSLQTFVEAGNQAGAETGPFAVTDDRPLRRMTSGNGGFAELQVRKIGKTSWRATQTIGGTVGNTQTTPLSKVFFTVTRGSSTQSWFSLSVEGSGRNSQLLGGGGAPLTFLFQGAAGQQALNLSFTSVTSFSQLLTGVTSEKGALTSSCNSSLYGNGDLNASAKATVVIQE